MSESGTTTGEILVQLVTPEAGPRVYHLEQGATLADLLSRSATLTTGRAVLIDGLPPGPGLPLRGGAVVWIVPDPGAIEAKEPWREVVPAFRDETLFREYSEILAARRRGDVPSKGEGE